MNLFVAFVFTNGLPRRNLPLCLEMKKAPLRELKTFAYSWLHLNRFSYERRYLPVRIPCFSPARLTGRKGIGFFKTYEYRDSAI
jgi:hypothetical protein